MQSRHLSGSGIQGGVRFPKIGPGSRESENLVLGLVRGRGEVGEALYTVESTGFLRKT